MWSKFLALAALAVCAAPLGAEPAASELTKPVRLEADGKPIDVDVGHAAPFVCDFDRDGLADLLVGQFGEGKLRIYKNVGTKEEPRFGELKWFEAGGTLGKVPSG